MVSPGGALVPTDGICHLRRGHRCSTASVLAIGLYGLVDPQDERFLGTVRRVEAELREGATVLRYRGDDGLPGTGA